MRHSFDADGPADSSDGKLIAHCLANLSTEKIAWPLAGPGTGGSEFAGNV